MTLLDFIFSSSRGYASFLLEKNVRGKLDSSDREEMLERKKRRFYSPVNKSCYLSD